MIYAIEHPFKPWIKVGTTCDLKRRMREYQGYGMHVKPFFTCRGGRKEEKVIHSMLQSAWVGGEWFSCSKEAAVLALENKNLVA